MVHLRHPHGDRVSAAHAATRAQQGRRTRPSRTRPSPGRWAPTRRCHRCARRVERGALTANEHTRTRLLQATLSCVERWGLEKTSLEDVARQAGLSRATVYRYFA